MNRFAQAVAISCGDSACNIYPSMTCTTVMMTSTAMMIGEDGGPPVIPARSGMMGSDAPATSGASSSAAGAFDYRNLRIGISIPIREITNSPRYT